MLSTASFDDQPGMRLPELLDCVLKKSSCSLQRMELSASHGIHVVHQVSGLCVGKDPGFRGLSETVSEGCSVGS